jgi:hypothetical protein
MLPDYLKPLIVDTELGRKKLKAAWIGLSDETQIQILTAANYRDYLSRFSLAVREEPLFHGNFHRKRTTAESNSAASVI